MPTKHRIALTEDVYLKLRELQKTLSLESPNQVLKSILDGVTPSGVTPINDVVMDEVKNHVLQTAKLSKRPKLIAYPGGDYYLFNDLNKVFTRSASNVFVEVFGGSCHSSLNVDRNKFKVIVCNDIDSVLITFFKLAQNNPEELVKNLAILPFSRELLDIALNILDDPKANIVTKAVMLFYATRSSYNGLMKDGGFKVARVSNIARTYTNAVAAIIDCAKRTKDVVFENKDYREILKLYDSKKTLFYLDPPYISVNNKRREKYYRFSFTLADLKTMARNLHALKGEFVLKISMDNYELIKNDLPRHNTIELEAPLYMIKTIKEKRKRIKMIIAYKHNKKSRLG